MMSNAAVWLGPTIVSLILAAVIGAAALAGLRALYRAMVADRAESLASAERDRIPVKLFHQQRELIDAVITELEASPITYSGFPNDIKNALYAAHDSARELERGKR